ncbi:MAG TPA: DUF2959 family protein [Candidatus Binatia bacterium]|nr:DUF2959 family protein [Candidatus Binatia bacterium]
MCDQRKTGLGWRLFSVSILPVALLGLAGCASAGYDKSNAAAYSMHAGAQEIQAESQALDQTLSSLKDLVDKPANLKQQYQSFSSALDHLIVCAQRADDTGKRIQAKGAAYFQTWDRELAGINHEHIRDLSQTRRSEVTNHFASVTLRYKENLEVVQPLISYLKDLRVALSADLTAAGLQSMKSVVANAEQTTAKVQPALTGLVAELTDSSNNMSSTVAVRSTDDGS